MRFATLVCVVLVVAIVGFCFCFAVHKGVDSAMNGSVGPVKVGFTTSHSGVVNNRDSNSRLP